ncbi:helix-turn-helix domain-containing protein [Gordonia sp. (in: high G+C Gram-positive bacteria)]|uniref:helix-turn-helix domain-containing protein n=1 Tax=Gordonia sp. (in: high G+C Gram-positive bacteria) TaxID=84139 RepID=UPI003F972B42
MPGSPPTRRVVDALECLAAADTSLTIAQIADSVGVPRPTMSAILSELDDAGWVERDADRTYRLGAGATALGPHGAGVTAVITPDIGLLLDELVTTTACGATVSRVADGRMTVLSKAHSQARPVPGLGIGQSLTISYPAGAAVMAWRSEAEQRPWLAHRARDADRVRMLVDNSREFGYVAYRPASSDASLVESLADLLGAVGPMLIDPSIRRSAIRRLSELSSRAYRDDDLATDESLPISYLAAPIFRNGAAEFELQLGVLRSSVGPRERDELIRSLIAAATRVSDLLDANAT